MILWVGLNSYKIPSIDGKLDISIDITEQKYAEAS